MPISEALHSYLRSWSLWAATNAEESAPFRRGAGLCDNVAEFPRTRISRLARKLLRNELEAALHADFGKTLYPFNPTGAEGYVAENGDGTAYKNRKRREWVQLKLAEYEASLHYAR